MSTVAQTAVLVHGYTMARVDRLADDAARKTLATRLIDPSDAREEAWQAIVSLLYSCAEKPTEWSLVDAAMSAIRTYANAYLRDKGLRASRTPGNGGYEETPHFNQFWVHIIGAKPDWTEGIVQRMALPRVLGVLTPTQYEAVVALAAHDDLARAAAALGVSYGAMKLRVQAARKKMLEAWFDDETPPRAGKRPASEACRYGHARAMYGGHDGAQWFCRLCRRNAARRRRAREDVPEIESVEDTRNEGPLTFAAPRELGVDEVPTGADVCWCGLRFGHDWPHKVEGAPHPRAA